jgi:hypothetical protein
VQRWVFYYLLATKQQIELSLIYCNKLGKLCALGEAREVPALVVNIFIFAVCCGKDAL